MRDACEALRLIGEDGLAVAELGSAVPPPGARDGEVRKVRLTDGNGEKDQDGGKRGVEVEMDLEAAAKRQKEVGKLYRQAMSKDGVWGGVPIEYARCQTETPSRAGWDHGWTR